MDSPDFILLRRLQFLQRPRWGACGTMQAVRQAAAASKDAMGRESLAEPGPPLARLTVGMGQACRGQGIWWAGELAGARRPHEWRAGVPGSQGSGGGGVGGTRETRGNSYLQKDVLCPSLIEAFHFQAVSE